MIINRTRRWASRGIKGALGIVTVLAALGTVGAAAPSQAAPGSAPASVTDLACNFDYITFNACLNFTEPVVNFMDVHVGLDARMPQRYADEIVQFGGVNTQAQLFSTTGRFITNLDIVTTGFPSSHNLGLSVSLNATGISRSTLNINPGAGAQESFFVQVSYFDQHSQGTWKTFRTGTVTGDFAPR